MNTAIILAAGLGSRFGDITKYVPKGMIKVGKQPMIQTSIETILDLGYDEIILVTGHCSSVYEEFCKKWGNVKIVKNPFYSTTGSLFSLYLGLTEAKMYYPPVNITIFESDIIYDKNILIQMKAENCMVVSAPRAAGLGDECWTQIEDGIITKITKNKNECLNPEYEMVGITNISLSTVSNLANLEKMIKLSTDMLYENNQADYESMITEMNIFKPYVTDKLWAEMDNIKHLEEAITKVLPNI
jgi:2-aminoethylphosphonate-pyruvate transaminase